MEMKLAVMTALALACSCTPAWAINKCTGSDGKVVFQDAPCAGSGALVADDVAKRDQVRQAKQAAERRQADQEAQKREAEYNYQTALERGRLARLKAAGLTCPDDPPYEPVIGMSEVMFLDCSSIGRNGVDTVNETQTARGVHRQYVMKKGWSSSARYVYTQGGVVTAIQR